MTVPLVLNVYVLATRAKRACPATRTCAVAVNLVPNEAKTIRRIADETLCFIRVLLSSSYFFNATISVKSRHEKRAYERRLLALKSGPRERFRLTPVATAVVHCIRASSAASGCKERKPVAIKLKTFIVAPYDVPTFRTRSELTTAPARGASLSGATRRVTKDHATMWPTTNESRDISHPTASSLQQLPRRGPACHPAMSKIAEPSELVLRFRRKRW